MKDGRKNVDRKMPKPVMPDLSRILVTDKGFRRGSEGVGCCKGNGVHISFSMALMKNLPYDLVLDKKAIIIKLEHTTVITSKSFDI